MFNIGDIVEIHPDGIHSCTKGTVVETGYKIQKDYISKWYPDKNLSLYMPPGEVVLCANDSKHVTVIWPDGSRTEWKREQ
jgi:hypothetical protein